MAVKNLHLEHLEDEIINNGIDGGRAAINFLQGLRDMMKGKSKKGVNMTVKWDGAPAIFAGEDPSDGQFFVAKKGIFNANPKIYKSHADIDADTSGDLSKKLKIAFDNLKDVGIKGVIQGDFMFDDSSRREEEIDGEKMYTFKPQLITYAVPVDSDIGKRIGSAKFGIVFHTNYEGNTLADATANYDVNVSNLKRSNDVWFDDAFFKDVSGSVLMTKDETAQVKKDLADAMGAYKAVPNAVWEAMKSNDDFIKNFKI